MKIALLRPAAARDPRGSFLIGDKPEWPGPDRTTPRDFVSRRAKCYCQVNFNVERVRDEAKDLRETSFDQRNRTGSRSREHFDLTVYRGINEMKRTYEKPILVKRIVLSRVVAGSGSVW